MVKRKRIKNIILKTIAIILAFIFIAFLCAIDSNSWIPTIVCLITGGYLVLFGYANGIFKEETYDAGCFKD